MKILISSRRQRLPSSAHENEKFSPMVEGWICVFVALIRIQMDNLTILWGWILNVQCSARGPWWMGVRFEKVEKRMAKMPWAHEMNQQNILLCRIISYSFIVLLWGPHCKLSVSECWETTRKVTGKITC